MSLKDPHRRYLCHGPSITACCVYDPAYYVTNRGFDKELGTEVTWHQFKTDFFSPAEIDELNSEVRVSL